MPNSPSVHEIRSSFPELSSTEADFIAEVLGDPDVDPLISMGIVANTIPSEGVESVGLFVGGVPVGYYIDRGDDFANTVVFDTETRQFSLEPWRTFLANIGNRLYGRKAG